MKINQRHFGMLKKVIETGCCTEAQIQALKTEEMLKFCRNIQEMADIVALQKAISEKRLVAFLAEEEGEKTK